MQPVEKFYRRNFCLEFCKIIQTFPNQLQIQTRAPIIIWSLWQQNQRVWWMWCSPDWVWGNVVILIARRLARRHLGQLPLQLTHPPNTSYSISEIRIGMKGGSRRCQLWEKLSLKNEPKMIYRREFKEGGVLFNLVASCPIHLASQTIFNPLGQGLL